MKKGQRKYRCGHCQKDSSHHWIELNRASGLKCPHCGSRDMRAVTSEARSEAANAQAVRVLGGTHSTTLPPDDERPRRKVT